MGDSKLVIEGESYKDALKKGLEKLKLTEEKVNTRILEEKKGSLFKKGYIKIELTPKTIDSVEGIKKSHNEEIIKDDMQAKTFEIKYTQEGVFLNAFVFDKPSELQSSIVEYIKIKEIKDVNVNTINVYINEQKPDEIQIAPPQIEKLIDEDISIDLSRDKIECYIVLKEAYGGKSITEDNIKAKLSENGIIYGVDELAVANVIENKNYEEKILVAKGLKPINGSNAKIVYYFDIQSNNTPKILEDGNVDFKQLNIIKNVAKDDLLAEIMPPTDGEVGYDVFGNEIPSLPGKTLNFKKSKNTYESDDGLKLYAKRNGQVFLKDGIITVSEIFEVPRDVDNTTGNIKFNGSVIVKGNVKSGFSIEADGDIIVYGVVEGAMLKSTGNIVLNRGVQGNNQAFLECSGNLIAKYIENSKVVVHGSIEADSLLHSNVMAKSKITVLGKKGLIAGGELKAGEEISAITIGSHMGTSTKLEVGMDPELKQKLVEHKNEKADIENKLDGLKKSIDLLKRLAKNGELSASKQEIFIKSLKAYELLRVKQEFLTAEISVIESKIDINTKASIHASKTIYPGVKITIFNATRQLYDEMSNCSLYSEDGEIVIGPYKK